MTYSPALACLADPTRQTIVKALAQGPQTVGALAKGLPISRPGVSQHLKVLAEAGLVTVEAQGTRRIYSVNPSGVAELRAWLDSLWDEALTAFHKEAAKLAKGNLP